MIVFLIGFMGCGKSRKGKELANLLKIPFIDIDDQIVAHTNMTIADYFAKHGEVNFRSVETEILQSFPYPDSCVVAVGGGLPCFNGNIKWMNTIGLTIYLKMSPPALVSRLHNRNKRPLIKGMDDKELLAFVEVKLAERAVYYEQAKLTVNGFSATAEAISEIIKKPD